MKSYVNYLQGLYSAMLVDVAERVPSLRVDCERDASRLLSLINSRGLSFLMIDLPEAGKHFDQCLASQRLTNFRKPGFRPFRSGGVIPRLFKGLLLRVFDESGVLRVDSDATCILLLRQLFLAAKKVKVACSDSRTWEHVHEFFETDRNVPSPTLSWDEDDIRLALLRDLHLGDPCSARPAPLFEHDHFDCARREEFLSIPESGALEAVQRTADIVSSLLGKFDPSEWRAKHGPGAVADQHHTQFKYDFPSWPSKLSNVFPLEVFGFANYSDWAAFVSGKDAHHLFSENEPPSKLISVPKTLKGPRLIASEPVSHQWCQQTIKDYFVGRLSSTPIARSIHFHNQSYNQEAARRASHTQSHVTVDLSSASDRLSCWTVERIFRRNSSLVAALHASRTRWVANAIDKKSPQFHKLRKFSCMGSACTFPVQSYVFAIVAIGSVLYSRNMPVTIKTIRKISREVLVFGDDIIIPKDGWNLLQEMLGHLRLKVNPHKTFFSGSFRESCGLDAYDGTDVTPTYSMTYPEVSRPESIASCVSTSNNFAMRGLLNASRYVRSRVLRLRRFALPYVPIGSGAFGWYDYDMVGNQHLDRRWNTALYRLEFRVDSLCSRSTRSQPDSNGLLLQFFTVGRPTFLSGDRLGVVGRTATSIRRRWVSAVELEAA